MLKGSTQDGCSYKVSKVSMKLVHINVDSGFVSIKKRTPLHFENPLGTIKFSVCVIEG